MNQKIFCDRKPFYVNKNCYLALKHLRKKSRERNLWIDNICIDQSSNEERGHQVELMGQIYANAGRLIIWLGEEVPGTKRAFRRRRYSRFLSSALQKLHVPYMVQKVVVQNIPYKKNEILLFQRLLRHEWPLRVWTLQEFLMSKGPDVVQCGRCTLSYTEFEPPVAFEQPGSLDKDCEWDIWDQLSFAKVFWSAQVASTPESRCHYAISEKPNHPLRDPSAPVLRGKDVWPWMEAVAEIWDSASRRSCSVPLDRIYGVYGLLRAMGLELPRPDYSKTVPQVGQELTLSMVSICGSLVPLYFFADQCSGPDTASWAIDWAHFNCVTNFRRSWGVNKRDFAIFDECHWPEIDNRLILKAILSSAQVVGTVVPRAALQTHRPPGDYHDHQRAMPKLAVLNWLRETMELTKKFQECPDGQLAWEAVLAVLIRGYHDNGERLRIVMEVLSNCGMVALSPERHFEIIANKSNELIPRLRVRCGEPIKQEDVDFELDFYFDEVMEGLMDDLTQATSRCQGGTPFRTPEGWIGLALRPVEPGDMLARIHGSSVPAILRPVGEHFRLVCFASVQGIPGGDWSINGDEEGVQSVELI